jgi:uncharacterized protein YecT (DUF1311 family)
MEIVLLNCKPMKLRFCVLLCVSTALAQTGNQKNSAGTSVKEPSHATQATIRQRGTEALTREQARSKIDLCAKAQTGGNAAIGACLVAEGKTTEQEYLTYVRSIGALLRLPTTGSSETNLSNTPQHLPFDAAEDTWRTYRDQSCTSMATQWEGGDQAPIAYANCRLTLTWNHMNELAALYADLWH